MAVTSSGPDSLGYLGPSPIRRSASLNRCLEMVGTKHNEYGPTRLFLESEARGGHAPTSYPFFFNAIFAGLVPCFVTFFTTILDHYRIHGLHLHPNSTVTAPAFVLGL